MNMSFQDIDSEALRILNMCYERAKEVRSLMECFILITMRKNHFLLVACGDVCSDDVEYRYLSETEY